MEKYKILFKKKQRKQFICAEIKDCDIFKSRNTVVIEKIHPEDVWNILFGIYPDSIQKSNVVDSESSKFAIKLS